MDYRKSNPFLFFRLLILVLLVLSSCSIFVNDKTSENEDLLSTLSVIQSSLTAPTPTAPAISQQEQQVQQDVMNTQIAMPLQATMPFGKIISITP